jgi:hypothetical protein
VNRALRSLSALGALGAASLTLAACDVSPYAAAVNGQTISVNSLNHLLDAWASNPAWVQSFDSSNAQSQGGSGAAVVGSGGPGTFSSQFVADVLGDVIQVTAVHQRLVATGNLPTSDEEVASRALNEALRAQYWDKWPVQIRSLLVEQLAEQGALTAVPSDPSALQQGYSEIEPYLFSSVCVSEASAFNAGQAASIIASGHVQGTRICYDQAAIEGQSAAFQAAILKLSSVGQVSAAVPTAFGFQVLQLSSRTTPGLSPGVERVLTIASAQSEPAAISSIVTAAHVKVNPAYGTWSNGQITTPQLSSS